jgi:hypothetical protein
MADFKLTYASFRGTYMNADKYRRHYGNYEHDQDHSRNKFYRICNVQKSSAIFIWMPLAYHTDRESQKYAAHGIDMKAGLSLAEKYFLKVKY